MGTKWQSHDELNKWDSQHSKVVCTHCTYQRYMECLRYVRSHGSIIRMKKEKLGTEPENC